MESGWIEMTALGSLMAALGAACGGSSTGGSGGSAGTAGTGATGGATGGASGSGGAGATGGSSTCDGIAAAYQQKLSTAKQCNPLIDMNQCTLLLSDSLACGCATFVSASEQIAVSELTELENQWNAANCGAGIMCEPCPPAPSSGYCEANGSVGTCVDAY